jgi:hypothetical protein
VRAQTGVTASAGARTTRMAETDGHSRTNSRSDLRPESPKMGWLTNDRGPAESPPCPLARRRSGRPRIARVQRPAELVSVFSRPCHPSPCTFHMSSDANVASLPLPLARHQLSADLLPRILVRDGIPLASPLFSIPPERELLQTSQAAPVPGAPGPALRAPGFTHPLISVHICMYIM